MANIHSNLNEDIMIFSLKTLFQYTSEKNEELFRPVGHIEAVLMYSAACS